MTVYYVGIDPGLSGAVAALDRDGEVQGVHRMPTHKVGGRKHIDLRALGSAMMLMGRDEPAWLAIEKPSARSAQGRASMLTIGMVFGIPLGMAAILGWHVDIVDPKVWKGTILKGHNQDKGASVVWAERRWPQLGSLRHDEADALGLAEYARRIAVGG